MKVIAFCGLPGSGKTSAIESIKDLGYIITMGDVVRNEAKIRNLEYTGENLGKVAKGLRLIESETSFQPSGIAIHPIDGEIYIISSVGKLLIILDRRGKVLEVKALDPKIFRQPEGICFSPAGDMFISSEGQGGKGYILKFKFDAEK